MHSLDLSRCDVAPDQRGKLLADGRSGQATEVDPPGDRFPSKSRDEDVVHVFGVPVVHHHQQPLASQRAHHVVQQQQRAVIRSVRVVEHDDPRCARGDVTQQPGHRIEQPKPVLARAVATPITTWSVEYLGCEPHEVGDYAELVGDRDDVDAGRHRAQHLLPRPVRRRAARLRRRPPRHRHAPCRGQPGQLLRHARLADPRLAPAQHDARMCGESRLKVLHERGQLPIATNQFGAHQRPSLLGNVAGVEPLEQDGNHLEL